MHTFRSLILVAVLAIATTAAHAAVNVYVNVGPYGYPVYAESYAPPCCAVVPGYYYTYPQYYPGRWGGAREWSEHQWRHEGRERGDWGRHHHKHRDRDDRGDHRGD